MGFQGTSSAFDNTELNIATRCDILGVVPTYNTTRACIRAAGPRSAGPSPPMSNAILVETSPPLCARARHTHWRAPRVRASAIRHTPACCALLRGAPSLRQRSRTSITLFARRAPSVSSHECSGRRPFMPHKPEFRCTSCADIRDPRVKLPLNDFDVEILPRAILPLERPPAQCRI